LVYRERRAAEGVRMTIFPRAAIVALLALAALLAALPAGASHDITQRVSVDSAGNQADRESFRPAISADGRFVAFDSIASNLVPSDTNGDYDVFVHDRQTGATTRVSVDTAGVKPTMTAGSPRLAAMAASSPSTPMPPT
jgi:hypothetical protein